MQMFWWQLRRKRSGGPSRCTFTTLSSFRHTWDQVWKEEHSFLMCGMLSVYPHPLITWKMDNTPISESNAGEIESLSLFYVDNMIKNYRIKFILWMYHGKLIAGINMDGGIDNERVGFVRLSVCMCYVRGWEEMKIDLQENNGTQKKENAFASIRRPRLQSYV